MVNKIASITAHSTVADHTSSVPADLRVQRSMDHIWEISALTPRAAHWIKANFADHLPKKDEETIKTDLLGANALTGKARLAGFLTEYVGPNATAYF